MIGTVSMGIRAPIIRNGDDLVEIVTGSILEAMKEDDLHFISPRAYAAIKGNTIKPMTKVGLGDAAP